MIRLQIKSINFANHFSPKEQRIYIVDFRQVGTF
jgi:hypothetical protein